MDSGGNPWSQDTVCIPTHPTESPKPHFMTQKEEKALQQEVESLMAKGAIKEMRLQGGSSAIYT